MDETTFQRELVRLKIHLSRMASTYHNSPSFRASSKPNSHSQDAFCDQLDDVKCRLQTMQMSLNCLIGMRKQQEPAELASSSGHTSHSAEDNLFSPNRLTLPSGPIFWQLFTSLRTDVRGLDSRVANLEQSISDLEDRVDRLEPPQFTPTGSEDLLFPSSEWDDTKAPTALPNAPAEAPIPFNAEFNSWNAGEYPYVNNFAPAAPSTTELGGWLSNPPMSGCHVGSGATAPGSEGVAFRDREIDQLEELVRSTQASLIHTEDTLHQRENYIQTITTQRDQACTRNINLERICAEQERSVKTYQVALDGERIAVQRLQADSRVKDTSLQEWSSKHYGMQQAFLEKQSQLWNAEQQIQQLQRELHDLHCNRQKELERVSTERDEEIQKLRDLFEAKEAVAYEQEKIIGRGAALIQEREREIGRLDRNLKLSKDDHNNEIRQRSRAEKLLNERDEEIAHLRASLTHALMPQSVLNKLEKDGKASEGKSGTCNIREEALPTPMPCSPFATAGIAGQTSASGRWTPKAFDYSQLPHERKRASAWETGSKEKRPSTFGMPSTISPPPPSASSMPATKRRDLRRSDSLRLLERLALAEEGSTGANPPMLQLNHNATRHKLPLDSLRPPLPAPLSPRKAASVADFASRSRADDAAATSRRPISRHQSTQDLPRPNLRAYVEDYESGGA